MFLNLSRAVENICYDISKNSKEEVHMAKKKDFNSIMIKGINYRVCERSKDNSEVLSIPYSIENYVDKVVAGKISRDVLIQRTDDQWTKKQKSKLIEAILHNRPVGTFAIALGRSESKSYTVSSLVDGLQRTTAIVEYKQDKFALSKNASPISCFLADDNGKEIEADFEIAGKKYSQLPDAIKIFFDEYRLDVYRYCGFTDGDLDDIVFCMNNGKSPTAYQKLRFALGSEVMKYLQPVCNSFLWDDAKGCKAKNDSILGCVVRTLMMMTFYNYKALDITTMMKFADEDVFNERVKESHLTKLATLVEELAEIKENLSGDDASKLDSITIPHYLITLNAFKNRGKSKNEFVDFLNKFWSNENFEFFTLCCESNGSGSSLYSAEMIEDRQTAIEGYIDEYLDECKENNMNEGEINGKEGNSNEDRETGDVDCGNNGNETDVISDVFDTEIMSDNSGTCDSPSGVEPEINECGNVLQRSEQGTWSA